MDGLETEGKERTIKYWPSVAFGMKCQETAPAFLAISSAWVAKEDSQPLSSDSGPAIMLMIRLMSTFYGNYTSNPASLAL